MNVSRICSCRSLFVMKGVLLVSLGCVSVSTGILFSKHLLESAPLLPFVLFQVLGGALSATAACLCLQAMAKGRAMPKGKNLLLLALPGIFQPGLTYPLFFASLAYIPLALAGMLASFETLFVVLLSFPLLKIEPRREQFLLAFCSLGGLLLMSWSRERVAAHWPVGVLLVLASMLFASLDTIACSALAPKSHSTALTAASCWSGTFVLLLVLLFSSKQNWQPFATLSTLGICLFSGVLIHGLGANLFNEGLGKITAAEAALLFPLISVISAVGGFVVYREKLNASQTLGGIIVIVSTTAVGFLTDVSDSSFTHRSEPLN
jgi:drug/metabolite transporter (DMT)-like permease